MMTNIDNPVANNTESDISRVSGNAFSLGSNVEVVVMRRHFAMVHADLENMLILVIFSVGERVPSGQRLADKTRLPSSAPGFFF